MLRTPTSSLLRGSIAKAAVRTAPTATTTMACRAASTHAISKPTLANIEKRWEGMPHQEQAELWMALRDRMKENWNELTLQEKKAAYYISFGPHGPRAVDPPGEGKQVFFYTAIGVGVSFLIFFAIRQFAAQPPHTMTKEWQEASNEYLKAQKSDPLTGVGSGDFYKGKGMVQALPGGNRD